MEPFHTKAHPLGVSIVEAMLAVVIFGMFATTFASAVIYAPQVTADSGQRMRATYVAETGLAAIDSIKQNNWSEFTAMQTGVQLTSNVWELTGAGTSDTVGDYTRQITITEVCRDASNAIAACPADRTDPNTFSISVAVSWQSRYGAQRTITASKYITNWSSSQFTQTDWVGGDSQPIWTDETKYDSDDANVDVAATPGQVSLAAGVGGGITGKGCGPKVYNFDTPGDYTTSSSDITVATGTAALTAYGTAVDANTIGLWHLNETGAPVVDSSGRGNNLNAVGNGLVYGATGKFSTGVGGDGNLDYWNITDATQTGLDLQGAMTLEGWYKPGSTATGIDYLMSKWGGGTATNAYVLYFNSNSANNGTIVFQLGNGTAVIPTVTSSAFSFNTSTFYHIAATYDGVSTMRVYLNGTQVGSGTYSGGTVPNSPTAFTLSANSATAGISPGSVLDEVRVSNVARYSGSFSAPTLPFGASYASTKPTIQPTASYDPVVTDRWQGFTEVATKSGAAQIYYQLSDDNGTTWKWWNGSTWATVSAATDYNTATTINTNITTFPTTNSQMLWRAFFVSNGSDNISLDTVTVTCVQTENLDFTTPADYTTGTGAEVSSGSARLTSNGTAIDVNTIGLWHFNESASPFLDYSANNNPITNYSFSLAQTGKYNFGVSGTAAGYGKLGFSSQVGLDISNTDFTFDFWVYKTSYSSQSDIIKKWGGTTASNEYRMYMNSSGNVIFEVANGSGTTATLISNGVIPLNTWTHVAAVYDDLPAQDASGYNSYMYLYINGAFDKSRPNIYTSLINPSAEITFGSVITTGLRGVLDEFRISNTARWTGTSGQEFTPETLPYGLSYVATSPTVTNVTAIPAADIANWYTFTETKAVQNRATVTYQLSNDGINWKYWNGSAWATATTTAHTNAGSVMNTNIPTFTTTGSTIYVKTFLNSNGADSASVDNIEIAFVQNPEADVTIGGGGGGAVTSGYLVSSAYDMAKVSDVLSVDWDEVLPEACDPVDACDVKLQIRTAPDNAGTPGTWTSWYGPVTADTFFTDPKITVTPPELNGNRWLQYRLELVSDGTNSPIVEEVRIRYQ